MVNIDTCSTLESFRNYSQMEASCQIEFSNLLTVTFCHMLSVPCVKTFWVTEIFNVLHSLPYNLSLLYVQNIAMYMLIIGPLILEQRRPVKICSWHGAPPFYSGLLAFSCLIEHFKVHLRPLSFL